jgi:hypothetical protein
MNEMRDRAADLAAILRPIPEPEDLQADEGAEEAIEQAIRAQRQLAEELRRAEGEGVDPLLSELGSAYRRKLIAEQEMRLLITYAREFAWPRPYRLVDLAQTAGLSTSGVRIAYRSEDVAEVAKATGRSYQANPATSRPGGANGD